MRKLKFYKSFLLGMFITLLSSTIAFAGTGVEQKNAAQSQQTVIESKLLEKQKEIDQYVFEKHAKEISDKGFVVTNTGQIGGYVEIGIAPFNKENADYLYSVFGKDMVKVVEGHQAVTMELKAGSSNVTATNALITLKNEKEVSQKTSPMTLALVGTAVVILLGGTMIIIRKRKIVNR